MLQFRLMVSVLLVLSISILSAEEISVGAKQVKITPLDRGRVFISPDGKGNDCSQKSPCAFIVGINKAKAGDVVFFRGGVYSFKNYPKRRIDLKGGEKKNPIIYESYPSEKAIFDGKEFPLSTKYGGIRLIEDYTVLRNLEVRNMPSVGVKILSNYNLVEGLNIHSNHLSGVGIYNGKDGYAVSDRGGSYNIIRNNIIHNNSDVGLSEGGYNEGGNADGISISCGVGNMILNNTVYDNSDDGIDTWKSNDSLVKYNLVYRNGKGKKGNGNGIKAGGAKSASEGLGYRAVVERNIVYNNRSRGIDYNRGRDVVFRFNTSFKNGGVGFRASDAHNTKTESNIAVANGRAIRPQKGDKNNSWQRQGVVTFVSSDLNSSNFCRPIIGGGFEDIGVYAK